jgi:hypothetical protein
MSLPQSTDPLGGLGAPPVPEAKPEPTSLEQLEAQGALARAQLDQFLLAARSRARWLLSCQLGLALLAALSFDLLASAGVAALEGPFAGRALFAGIGCALAIALFVWLKFFARGSLARAAMGKDRAALATLLIGKSETAGSSGSELLSSIELSHTPPRGTSFALLSLLHQRAALTAKGIDLRKALPGAVLRVPVAALLAALLAAVVFAAKGPQPLRLGLLRLWLGEAAMPIPENEPIAGDLSITYLYPAYTNLPARMEEGTPGDLKAPKGTQAKLTARADRDLVQAYAVVDGKPIQLEVSGPGNRQLAGTIPMDKSGKWRLRFADKKARPVAEGPDRSIEVLLDQPPTANISDPAHSEVEVDPLGKLPVSWSALDDYGLGNVALIYSRDGDPEQRIELSAPQPGSIARRLSGTYGWEMAPLQLREGDKVSFRIEATDQDVVDGAQKGKSSSHTLKVFSAAEHHKEGLQRAQALWERLVLLLGARLSEKPPSEKEKDWYANHSARDNNALQLISELKSAGVDLSKDKLAPRALGRALKYVATALSPLVQKTVITRAPLSKLSAGAAPPAGNLRLLARALEVEIKEEEKDVLYLDDLLDQARIDDLQDLQRELKRSRQELKRLAEKLKSAPDEQTKKQVLAEVERLKSRIQELMERMAAMAKGINDEHLNQEAQESVAKEQDLMSELSDVQKKMQAGDVDAALAEMEKLNKKLEALEQNLDKSAEERGGEKYSEEGKQLKAAAEKLSALKGREEELEKRTGKLRKELRQQAQKRFEQKGGKQLAQKLQEKVAQAKKQIGAIDPHVADGLGLEDTLDAARERVADLERALQAGDYQEALDQANKAERAAFQLQSRLTMEDQMHQTGSPFEVRKSLEAAALGEQPLREVAQALREAMPDEGGQLSPEEKQEMQSQEGEQRQIQQGMQGVRDQISEVGKKVPIFGPQHEQLLKDAQDAMDKAGGALGGREPRGAEGAEGEALDKMGKFEEAMKEMAKGGKPGAGGMPMPWGEPQGQGGEQSGSGDGEQDGEGDKNSKEKVEIPDAESSRGPQEFRKKLLDAMKQPAPEKFKDKVRGYYEELVK